ncbi:acyclic terpene utilization AtuA family protein [Hoeflea sp. TYP-13]|uniref:acyclic terpene utilization AtuA family protein n=1 Tax=Hoeflea sp. TYP-13 TaxID=3230023 RepID=UPI0034C6672F
MAKTVRIGCGAGFWGDTPEGPAQLVRSGDIDYLVLDYLAEITMSILARMKARRPEFGYATDFVSMVAAPLAQEIANKGIRIVTNAGGVNLEACRDALSAAFEKAGVDLKIAIVRGDDLSGQSDRFHASGAREMFSGAPLPAELASVNAYLGAFPIAKALAEGADIVLTGRATDSALALGPLIHEFGWGAADYDRLAAGSLAGHVLECGTQATGGIFTDWRDVEGWDRMGFPIAECHEDGSFDLTKPEGTGGLVSPMTVAEQIVYEIGDPAAYVLPDVICDFSEVRLSQAGRDRVRVKGAHGRAPTSSYKVSATYADGYRAGVTMMIAGNEAVAKAEAVGAAILSRASRLMKAEGHADFSETSVEVLGGESTYGAHSTAHDAREVILKIAVRHDEKAALKIFAREIYPAATAMAQGLTGFAGGRPDPQPVIRLFSFLVDKADVPVEIEIDGRRISVPIAAGEQETQPAAPAAGLADEVRQAGSTVEVPLLAIAHGRSGDKGDIANIGILARRPEFAPVIRNAVTEDTVRDYFSHIVKGKVERFDWPGLNGFNFLLHGGLGGGGIASLRHDPQGKTYAQMLLDLPVDIPVAWLDNDAPLANWSTDEIRQEVIA